MASMLTKGRDAAHAAWMFYIRKIALMLPRILLFRYLLLLFWLTGQASELLAGLETDEARLAAEWKKKDDKVKADHIYELIEKGWRYSPGFYLEDINRGIELCNKLNYDERCAGFYNLKGKVLRTMNQTVAAAKAYMLGIELARKVGSSLWQSQNHLSLGTLFCEKRDLAAARIHLDKSMAIADEAELRGPQIAVYRQLAVYFGLKNQHDSAFIFQKKALDLSDPAEDRTEYGRQMLNMGITYKKLKNYAQALSWLKRCSSMADSTGNDWLSAAVAVQKSWVYYETGKYDLAIFEADQGLLENKTVRDPEIELEGLSVLHRSLFSSGNAEEAYRVQERYRAMADTIYHHELVRQARELTMQYSLKEKDENLAEKQLRISRIRMVAIIVSVFLFIIVTLVWLFYRSARRKNHHLRRLNAEIRIKNYELEKLNNVKSVVFTVISHDLRSPLNALKVFTDRILQGKIPEEKVKEYISEISRDIHISGNLVDNLLDWSQTQMSGYRTHIQSVDLKSLVDGVVAKSMIQINGKGISLEQDIPEGATVKADAELTTIIIRNLLNNAIKFTPSGNPVYISFQPETRTLLLRDTGIGMDAGVLEKIYQNSLKVTTPGTANEKGTGFGLMISKSFATLMNCWLAIRSEQGKGTEISLKFPE